MDDVLIVGGSFAGLTAGLQLVRTGRTVTVLDTKLPRNRFVKAAHGVLGFDGASPWDIRKAGERDFLAYPTASIVDAKAISARHIDSGFAVIDEAGVERQAKRLILAYGLTDAMPDLPGFAESWGKSVVPCPYCDGYEVANTRLGVLHTNPMSVHVALLIQDWSRDMTLFANGAVIADEDRQALAARGIKIVEPKVTALAHNSGMIQSVVLEDGSSVPLDALFAHPRHAPSSRLHETLGIETAESPVGRYIKVNELFQTNVKNVFAAGDGASAMHSVTNALYGGAMAGVMCHRSMVFPD
ncbi:NAD(P)/FAD-dependent oxidoreductase [Devosia sp.]|uniref:NAD(P)/FAD-dependent oxidoreductase n=1 Tax=Devosia sp. TaxID=1871048 RepID=UPI0032660C9E